MKTTDVPGGTSPSNDPEAAHLWVLESWATNPDNTDQAVKVTIRLRSDDEPDANAKAKFKGRASGLFRSTYGDWAESFGDKVTRVE